MSESNINVAVKIRPLIKRELEKKIPACWKVAGSTLTDTLTGTNEFSFDLIFDENSSTMELYEKVASPIVKNALAGVNGTVFAYGQTSSGKTHTMMGNETNDGLMLMAIKHIFNEVQSSNIEFVLRVGFIEIYNEKVYDLYDPDNLDLKMVEKNNDAYVNCKEAICKCVDDMYNVIKIGNKNKKIGDTDMNDRSSRSHTIFRISIESIDAVSEKAKISNLNLVDLAGSERASQTNSTGTRFVEGAHINKSLLSLSKVVNKLINNDNCHINYRDSKLTRYLQSSLGGNALAAIICTICPTTLEETISTLYFAQRAMKVTNKPRVNEIISDATMIKQLHNQIKALKGQLELEKAKNEGNQSAVPRILQELSLHQGNILNYRKAENKAKLRRRTWTTFDNELAVISEAAPLVITHHHQHSLGNLNTDAVAPVLHPHMVTAGRGTGEDFFDVLEDREKMANEFDYKSKYEKLLNEYEELQEFTDWENKLGVEPDAEAEFRTQIDALEKEKEQLEEEKQDLEKDKRQLEKEKQQLQIQLSGAQQEKSSVEYLYEQHQKKAEQRERDLVSMLEELKSGAMANGAMEEKNQMIRDLQEQIKELSEANDMMVAQAKKYEDVEERLEKMSKVEFELEEFRKTITALSHTISTLENEKKEMSIRFNESVTGMAVESSQLVAVTQSPVVNGAAAPVTSTVLVQSCQTEVVMSDNSKLQADYDELSCKVMDLIEENEELKQRAQELDEKLNEMDVKAAELEMSLLESAKAQTALAVERDSLQETLSQKLIDLNEMASEKNLLSNNCETQSEEVALIRSEKEYLDKEMQATAAKFLEIQENSQKLREELESTLKSAEEELMNSAAKLTELLKEKETLSEELDKRVQEMHAITVERDCLANDLKNRIELIAEMEKNVESGHSELKKDLMDAQMEKSRLTTEGENKSVELEQLRKEHEEVLMKLSEQKTQFEQCKEQMDKSQADNSELKKELREMEQEKTCLANEVESKTLELEQLRKDHDEGLIKLSEQQSNFVQFKDQMEKEVEQLRGDLRSKETEIETKLREMQSGDETKEALEQRIKSLQLEIDNRQIVLSQQAAQFEATNGQMEKDMEQLKTELRAMEKEMENKLEEVKLANESKLTLEDRIKLLELELENSQTQLTQQAARFDESKSAWDEEMQKLKADVQDKSDQLNIAQLQLQTESQSSGDSGELEKERDRLTVELDVQLQKVHSLTKEMSTMKVTIEEMEQVLQEKDQGESNLEDLKREVADKAQQITELEGQLESASAFERELELLREEKTAVQINLETQLEKVHALTKERHELRGQLESLHDSLTEKEEELKRVQEEAAELALKRRQRDSLGHELQEKVQALEHQVILQAEEIRSKDEQIDEFLSQMRELETLIDGKINDLSTARQAMKVMSEKVKELEASLEQSGSRKDDLMETLKVDKERLTEEVSTLKAECRHAEQRFNEVASQLRETEEDRRELATKLNTSHGEVVQLRKRLEAAMSKRAEVEEKSSVIRNRLEELESELGKKEQQLSELTTKIVNTERGSNSQRSQQMRAHEEEVDKLQGHIKKLRNELSGSQNKERRARRSSQFDTNRDLFAERAVGTQTDPVSESCQCEALNVKINELKKSNLLKDLQMVELREAEKRSPMLLENYNLKKMTQQYREQVADKTKELKRMEEKVYQALKQCKRCESRKMQSVQCQTMPDMNPEVISDMKRELAVRTAKYEDVKRIVVKQQDQIKWLESAMAELKNDAAAAAAAAPATNENDQNGANGVPTLQQKYAVIKGIVEKRYHTIRRMEGEIAELKQQRTCLVCRNRLQLPPPPQ